MRDQARVVAVLGPTNTGKTHYAVERMLAHRTGVIGLPLRLLAREVYDRIVAARGPSVVALVTGEERIVPERTAYWVCTVEAMPLEIGADFVAVDEIQLCADPDRGHVFTDRLLRARGLHETLFMGSDTMRAAIAAQVPGVQFMRRDRMSELTWTGAKKLSRLPPRSAIVGFSVENVYAIAELMRRQKGGCAVVMGALSPRTRNAQVALYQNGDVDFLVATDAIGMGLNLDIRHVAFSSTVKFDGRRMRALSAQEMAQIAGRAGRHLSPGSFGLTGDGRPPGEETIAAIEAHRFEPVRKLHWRNAALHFGTVERLIASLEAQSGDDWLMRMRDADDLVALRSLSAMPEIAAALTDSRAVRLLWDVCRIPDFRGISPTEHAGLLARIFGFLHDAGQVPDGWLARNIARIDRIDGDIDALSRRLAFIRTWTYVAQRRGWVGDEAHWRGETRAVEDRLSDALHARLTQRFVDRRTSVLMRRLKQKESLVAEVNDKGEVTVEGEFIGRLEGFRFRQDKTATPDEARTLRQAAVKALAPHFHLRADQLYNSPDAMLDLTEQGGLMWGDTAVGKLVAGPEPLKPRAEAFVDEAAGDEVAARVQRRLQHFIDRRVAQQFEPLLGLMRDETLTGLTRGFGFRLVEAMGLLPRSAVADEVRALDQDARAALRRHGVRFGQFTVFLPALLKPAPTRLRLVLWSLAGGLDVFPESPPPGLVTIPVVAGNPAEHYRMAGYEPAGPRAIRIDMLERLADLLRGCDSRAGFEATPDMLSITGLGHEAFAELMEGLGYRATRGERPRARPATAATVTPDSAQAAGAAPAAAEPAQVTHAPDQPDTAARPDATPDDTATAPADRAAAPEAAGAAAGSAIPEGADGAALPETPATDSPATDSPATGSPATDSPATDSLATDSAATDSPATDSTATGSPATDSPATDSPAPSETSTTGSGQPPPGARPDRAPADAADAAAIHTDTPPPAPDMAPDTGAGTPAAGASASAETETETSATPTEVFFTFTWARRSESRSRGGQRRPHGGGQHGGSQHGGGQHGGGQHGGIQKSGRGRPAGEAATGGEGAASGDSGHRGAAAGSGKPARGRQSAPHGKSGKPKGKGDGAKHGRHDSKRTETARSYSAGPDSRGKDRIDPDNPFARALMGLRDRD